MISRKRIVLGIIPLLLTACVSLSPPENPNLNEVPSIQFDAAPDSVKAHLEAGEEFLKKGFYKEALDEFKNVLKIDRTNESAQRGVELAKRKSKVERERVAQSLLQLKDTGAELYQRQEFVPAGQAWKEAIQLYQTHKDPDFQPDLAFNVDEIQVRVDRIILTLLEKGVLLYRQGKLEAAISAWQDVLLIDPQQRVALDYINKARTKIETLEHLSSSASVQPSPDKKNQFLQGQAK